MKNPHLRVEGEDGSGVVLIRYEKGELFGDGRRIGLAAATFTMGDGVALDVKVSDWNLGVFGERVALTFDELEVVDQVGGDVLHVIRDFDEAVLLGVDIPTSVFGYQVVELLTGGFIEPLHEGFEELDALGLVLQPVVYHEAVFF